MSAESYITISKVIICIKQLKIFLNTNINNTLARKLQETLHKYFSKIETDLSYSIATILDPRFKMLGVRNV